MGFRHQVGGPDQCDPAAGPEWACEGCIKALDEESTEGPAGPTCRCDRPLTDPHPDCAIHGDLLGRLAASLQTAGQA